ncbi:Sele, partial [Symbiodinium microadriaticum]
TLNCGIDGSFNTTGAFECRPKQCRVPSSKDGLLPACPSALTAVPKRLPKAFTYGWEIGGNATVMLCDDTPLSSAGFAEYVGRIPAENSSGPVCTAKPCTIGLPNLRGTSSDCSGKATLETCTVTALPGFTMTDSVLTCLPDSSFNGTISEVVESSCPDRAQVTGYASTCQDKKPGDECWVYCETGYTGNPAPYMCDADTLTFVAKDANASCVGSGGRRLSGSGGCQAAAAAAFGLSDPQFTHDCSSGSGVADGSICIAHCSRGYELVGVASVLTCNSGSLSGTLPVCTPLPCTYNGPDAVGLQHNCSNVTTGGSCSAGCTQEGFEYASGGAAQYQCANTGEFAGTLPSCQRTSCTDLTLGSKFAHNCESMVFQDTCGVSCAKGWTLVGWGS